MTNNSRKIEAPANRRDKIGQRVNNHTNSIGSELMTQGLIAGGKYAIKETLNTPQSMECNSECK